MEVTEVKIKLVPRSDSKLLAFASVTFNKCFVVRDIKVIQGTKTLFVAMPSRKITDHCKKCGSKNHLQALYCNQCGTKLPEKRTRPDGRGRAKLHADIAHPINVNCRQEMQDAILKGYAEEMERSRQPGYVPAVFDEFDAGPDVDADVLSERPSNSGLRAVQNSDGPVPPPSSGKAPPTQGDGKGFGILGS